MKRIPFHESRCAEAFRSEEGARTYLTKHAKVARMLARRHGDLLRKLGFSTGKLLDAGSAAGDGIFEIAPLFPEAEMVGLDLFAPFVAMGTERAGALGLQDRVSFREGDCTSMPFADDSFDAILSLNTLHCVEEPVAMLNECDRVLKPGGVGAIGLPRRSWLAVFEGAFGTSYTPSELEALAEESNLRNWSVKRGWIFLTLALRGA